MNSTTQLQQLFNDHWEAWMRWDPLFATQCGDNRYNDRLPTITDAAFQYWRKQMIVFRDRQRAIDRAGLSDGDRLNYDIFARLLDNEITEFGFPYYRVLLTKSGGFHLFFPDLYLLTPLNHVQDYENYITRLTGLLRYFQEAIDMMRLGVQTGYKPPLVTLDGILESLKPHLSSDPEKSVFYQPCLNFPGTVDETHRSRLCTELKVAIRGSVVPAYQALEKFLQAEYLPSARESIAASEIPDGRAFYQHRIRYFTTLDLTPKAVHQTGQEEVRRIRTEMESIIRKTGFEGDFRAFITFLRTDPRFYASTPEQLLKETAFVLKRMDGELPSLFKTLPRLPYGIRAIPEFSAPGNTTAYYQPGAGDGTRAGTYYVNTYDLKSRPLYEIEALSLHEAVPGHHLQIAIQQELGELPNFRRFSGFTSFVEGWALYAERLGLEVGFYTDLYSDFGRLSYEMWRACRLVVDTGMHALGWTRQQAIDFMAENTSSTLLNITNEVDRYIGWPGQALAYKIGELKIRELRVLAEQKLGAQFDRREFHDLLLGSGAVSLDMLENLVREWINQSKKTT
jgi:uncharacterized protein (DUF885 family)